MILIPVVSLFVTTLCFGLLWQTEARRVRETERMMWEAMEKGKEATAAWEDAARKWEKACNAATLLAELRNSPAVKSEVD